MKASIPPWFCISNLTFRRTQSCSSPPHTRFLHPDTGLHKPKPILYLTSSSIWNPSSSSSSISSCCYSIPNPTAPLTWTVNSFLASTHVLLQSVLQVKFKVKSKSRHFLLRLPPPPESPYQIRNKIHTFLQGLL